jgi:hypothetical protein
VIGKKWNGRNSLPRSSESHTKLYLNLAIGQIKMGIGQLAGLRRPVTHCVVWNSTDLAVEKRVSYEISDPDSHCLFSFMLPAPG